MSRLTFLLSNRIAPAGTNFWSRSPSNSKTLDGRKSASLIQLNPGVSASNTGKNFACDRGSSLRSEYKKLNLQFHYRRARAAFVLLRLGHGVHMRMVF